jgi:NAD(P)-dependent dehydrogenase (short-subunit alcohol dehydrogenase family)
VQVCGGVLVESERPCQRVKDLRGGVPVIFDDVSFISRRYDRWVAYGQSKTANVLFAVEASRRWAGDGITANAVHPGAIAETNLSRHMDPEEVARLRSSERTASKRPSRALRPAS